MDPLDLIHSYWFWLTLGLVLIIFEILIVPTSFLLWFGQAALVTGALVWAMPELGWESILLFFAIVSITSVVLGRVMTKSKADGQEQLKLNQRMQHYIGREVEIVEAIRGGVGRAKLGDTTWRVTGPNAAVGEQLVVVSVDGATLVLGPTASGQ